MQGPIDASPKANSRVRPGAANIGAGWVAITAGVLSGAALGRRFHRDDFMGGYATFPRRLARLGHISFFGLGILNILYGLSAPPAPGRRTWDTAGMSLIVGAITMPAVCFMTAWRSPARHLFAVPVGAVLIGVAGATIRSLRHQP